MKRFIAPAILITIEELKKRKVVTREMCLEVIMTPMQREVFDAVELWWERFGYAPSLEDIARLRGKSGLGNTKRLVDKLVELGALKKRGSRSVRPSYIRYRNLPDE